MYMSRLFGTGMEPEETIEAGQIMGSGGTNSSEEDGQVQDSALNIGCESFE
jgi:hypothetical protein